jgi:hypothetical protein
MMQVSGVHDARLWKPQIVAVAVMVLCDSGNRIDLMVLSVELLIQNRPKIPENT